MIKTRGPSLPIAYGSNPCGYVTDYTIEIIQTGLIGQVGLRVELIRKKKKKWCPTKNEWLR